MDSHSRIQELANNSESENFRIYSMYLCLNFSFSKIEDGHFEDNAGHLVDNATQALHYGACNLHALHLNRTGET